MGGPQGGKTSLPPGFDPRTIQHVGSRYTEYVGSRYTEYVGSRYTEYANPTDLITGIKIMFGFRQTERYVFYFIMTTCFGQLTINRPSLQNSEQAAMQCK
jgi:hypothetical protein